MVFTTLGKNLIRNWLSGGQAADYPQYMEWGLGSASAAVTDTALGNAGSDPGKIAFDTVTTSAQEVQYTSIIPSTGGSNITFAETGVWSGSPTGSLYCRATFTPTTKTNLEEWQTTIIFKVS